MDSNADTNPAPVNPTPPPAGGASAAGAPDHAAEVSALKAWLKENSVSLIITAVAVVLVYWFNLDALDIGKVIFGLGLIIFIHELGHFLAAKFCDVHVKTFSIGFGPAVPFCSYKWGETTYMVGIIPLGGYVSMVGEGDNAAEEEAEEDPRSFRHKTVGQRMLIISAGVVMNIVLGMGCFVAAYMHGVREEPAILGDVISGGAAWRAGLRADDKIVQIGSRHNPSFKDLRPIVMSTRKGERVPVVYERDGKQFSTEVEPLLEEGTNFPTLGVHPQYRTTVPAFRKKKDLNPALVGSPADRASPRFQQGDSIVGMSDPADPTKITALKPDKEDPGNTIIDYYFRMAKLAKVPVQFSVVRKTEPPTTDTTVITVQPGYRGALGLRMQMGEIVALRADGPAAQAGVKARTGAPEIVEGDKIKILKLPEAAGKETWFCTGEEKEQPNVTVRRLDPVLLPLEVKAWAERNATVAKPKLKLEVLRTVGHVANKSVELEVDYDRSYTTDREFLLLPNSPIPLEGLGLAYWVEALVENVAKDGPADRAGLQPKDVITAVRFKTLISEGVLQIEDWKDVKVNQWASVENAFQSRPGFEMDVRVKRGDKEIEFELVGVEDRAWAVDDRGLMLESEFVTIKAADIGEALNMGALRTVRFIREVYMNLYSMVFGRVSPKTISGPLTIATASYRIAGEDLWQFLIFLGMISVNLAVVNFLPIPVLDGGHMVFLILEKVLGRPVPDRIFAFAMYTGLFLILSLMGFAIFMDVKRLF